MHPPAPRDLRRQALQKQALLGAVQQHETGAMESVLEDDVPGLSISERAGAPSTTGRGEQVAPAELPGWEHSWSSSERIDVPGRGTFRVLTAGASGPVLLCLHGGGYTGLTWSLVAEQLSDRYRVVAPDLRGHGETSTPDDADLSAEALSEDVVALWRALFGSAVERVPVVVVGHSMGGAVAVRAAASKAIEGLQGVVVIDVVEGTALAALPAMLGVLNTRPSSFHSPHEAIKWALRSGMVKNRKAAVLSLPSQLRQASPDGPWVWRTNLHASRTFWGGWYSGLSELFLGLPCPKLLLLAGTDRLDKELTIGQMQGRFQLVLMPTAGHAIQEDQPEKAAEHLRGFLQRFRVGEPPMTFPRAPPGTRPALPLVAGPVLAPAAAAGVAASQQPQLQP